MKTTLLGLSLFCLPLLGCGSSTPAPDKTAPAAKRTAPTPVDAPEKEVLLSGTIELGMGAVTDKASAVFVSLKGGPGPPIAAKKLANGPFPMKFVLTTADMPMRSGRPIPEKLKLKVALDGDGNPMSKEGLGEVVVDVQKGATGATYTVTAPVPPPQK